MIPIIGPILQLPILERDPKRRGIAEIWELLVEKLYIRKLLPRDPRCGFASLERNTTKQHRQEPESKTLDNKARRSPLFSAMERLCSLCKICANTRVFLEP